MYFDAKAGKGRVKGLLWSKWSEWFKEQEQGTMDMDRPWPYAKEWTKLKENIITLPKSLVRKQSVNNKEEQQSEDE